MKIKLNDRRLHKAMRAMGSRRGRTRKRAQERFVRYLKQRHPVSQEQAT